MNKVSNSHIIDWLVQGDISIQYQVFRDLLGEDRKEMQNRIEKEGWGKQYLSKRNNNGHWGLKFYQPKWTSTHYTLLDLKNIEISPTCLPVKETIDRVLKETKAADGGILPVGEMKNSDMCINGMVLNYCSYFGAEQKDLQSIVDVILMQQLADGGFNCRLNRSGAVHSSLHTTISVLEGIYEYIKNHYNYRLNDLLKVKKESEEFILQHHLYKSDKTGEIIDKRFLNLTYPCRWRYDILRALDYFWKAKTPYDNRMQDAFDVILKKKNKHDTWNVQAHHQGAVHFHMEKAGKPSRWNTLRALRVLNYYHPTANISDHS